MHPSFVVVRRIVFKSSSALFLAGLLGVGVIT
jgi:hypothetical protein